MEKSRHSITRLSFTQKIEPHICKRTGLIWAPGPRSGAHDHSSLCIVLSGVRGHLFSGFRLRTFELKAMGTECMVSCSGVTIRATATTAVAGSGHPARALNLVWGLILDDFCVY